MVFGSLDDTTAAGVGTVSVSVWCHTLQYVPCWVEEGDEREDKVGC